MADSVELLIGRIEGKIDTLIINQTQHHDRLNNHGDRISKLEKWQSWVLGAFAVVALICGAVFKFVK